MDESDQMSYSAHDYVFPNSFFSEWISLQKRKRHTLIALADTWTCHLHFTPTM